MSTLRNKTLFWSCLVVLILLAGGAAPPMAASGSDLLPEGLVMEETFSPGRGRSIGRVQIVQGESVVMHADELRGYRSERGMRLYDGDTIVTLENARIRFRLNDGSILSLASETQLTLNKSVYQQETGERSSFLSMVFGQARFFVVKLLDFKRSEFKVKTPTAVCGVRGSDFILEASAMETVATALEDTEIELRSLAFLDEEPVVLKDYETSAVKRGQLPTTPVRLPADEVERKRGVFLDVTPGEDDSGMQDFDDLGGKAGDDAGLDEAGDFGEDQKDLEPPDVKRRTAFERNEEYSKDLPVPDPYIVKEPIAEQGMVGELPDFPVKP